MDWQMLFILASIVFFLAVYVGAIMWAVRDAPVKGVDAPLERISEEIRELFDADHRNAT